MCPVSSCNAIHGAYWQPLSSASSLIASTTAGLYTAGRPIEVWSRWFTSNRTITAIRLITRRRRSVSIRRASRSRTKITSSSRPTSKLAGLVLVLALACGWVKTGTTITTTTIRRRLRRPLRPAPSMITTPLRASGRSRPIMAAVGRAAAGRDAGQRFRIPPGPSVAAAHPAMATTLIPPSRMTSGGPNYSDTTVHPPRYS